jgi:hypothetical protein
MPFTIEMEIFVFKNLEPDPEEHYKWVAHIVQTSDCEDIPDQNELFYGMSPLAAYQKASLALATLMKSPEFFVPLIEKAVANE